MKKFTYLLAVAAMMTACSGNKGYVVTGTVEGGADGETVYLQKREKRNLVKLDSAVITNGTFTFKGTQDTAMNCYVTWAPEGKENLLMNFFLENGNINIELTRNNDSATGTPNNNAYQEIRSQINEVNSQLNELFKAMSDTALTAEQREAKMKEVEALTEKMSEINKKGVFKNITNAVGIQ
ncbi:MAG: DUF4369 domain-containing protein, partial [Bacteroides sp.]|nr:DUF4369 domain-containing protein [Bacteroides sp.]